MFITRRKYNKFGERTDQVNSVTYKPLHGNTNKPFIYKGLRYTRDEIKAKGLEVKSCR